MSTSNTVNAGYGHSNATRVGPVLDVSGLCIAGPAGELIVDNASLRLETADIFALVGESGSGKTLLSKALLRLLPAGLRVSSGRIGFGADDISTWDERRMRSVRGSAIGMVFQEPLTSLNPALKIGFQMAEGLRLHTALSEAQIRARSIAMLRRVQIDNPEAALDSYPHQFSGGMRQRIMLASVLLLQPRLLIADEPTTALDVIIQQEVLDIMVELAAELNIAVLLITHDLALVAQYAGKIAVMEKGVIVESGAVADVLRRPACAYTRKLLAALPGRRHRSAAFAAAAEPLLEASNLRLNFVQRRAFWRQPRTVCALNDVSISIMRQQTVAVVGESGSGKTTLGRVLLCLQQADSGSVVFKGQTLTGLSGKAQRALRKDMQIVFQDPFSSLDPRMRIGDIVAEALRRQRGLSAGERDRRVDECLAEVGLDSGYRRRFPHQLSGGQRQRVGIARAVILRPAFIVADEPVSALDVTVQMQVLKLLKRLQQRHRFSCLFISHDLSVVEQIADRVLVMYRGSIVEQGDMQAVFDNPGHPYTAQLLRAMPEVCAAGSGWTLRRRAVDTPQPPAGYQFACWDSEARRAVAGSLPVTRVAVGDDHFISCTSPP